MAKKADASAQKPDAVKFSVIVPGDLNARLLEMADEQGVTLSALVRDILESRARKQGAGRSRQVVVTLDAAVADALDAAAEQLNTWREAIAGELIARHLPGVIDEARRVSQKLRDSMQPPRRGKEHP